MYDFTSILFFNFQSFQWKQTVQLEYNFQTSEILQMIHIILNVSLWIRWVSATQANEVHIADSCHKSSSSVKVNYSPSQMKHTFCKAIWSRNVVSWESQVVLPVLWEMLFNSKIFLHSTSYLWLTGGNSVPSSHTKYPFAPHVTSLCSIFIILSIMTISTLFQSVSSQSPLMSLSLSILIRLSSHCWGT